MTVDAQKATAQWVTLRWGTAAMLATLLLAGVLALLFAMSRFMKLWNCALDTLLAGADANFPGQDLLHEGIHSFMAARRSTR
jgi:hypothetical protein